MKKYLKLIIIWILSLFFICMSTVSFSSSESSYVENYKIAFSLDDIMNAGNKFTESGKSIQEDIERYDELKKIDEDSLSEDQRKELMNLEIKINKIDQSALQKFSKNMYNILLMIGITLSVIIGIVLGIKYMISSVSEKASVKEMLLIYVISCVVVFGGFGIWKLMVNIMETL